MKLYHYTLAFVLMAIFAIAITDIRTQDFNAVIKNKDDISTKLDKAMDDGIDALMEIGDDNEIKSNKDAAIKSFKMSLYSSFGIIDDTDAKEKLDLYIPVMAITDEDGYSIYYKYEYTGADGMTYMKVGWTEELPYHYEDDDFIYRFTLGDKVILYDKNLLLDPTGQQKTFKTDFHDLIEDDEYLRLRQLRPDSPLLTEDTFYELRNVSIKNCLEKSMAYYTGKHNEIAHRYGIKYDFSFPAISEGSGSLVYYIEQSGTNLIYHTKDCPHLQEAGIVYKDGTNKPYYNKEDCLTAGAKACPECIKPSYSEYFEAPSMFVLFQGYPYGAATGEVYNRFLSASSEINKNVKYYIEQKSWYYVYHLSTCPLLDSDNPEYVPVIYKDGEKKAYYRVQDCVAEGAYACPVCIKNGVYAPAYETDTLVDGHLRVITSLKNWDSAKMAIFHDANNMVMTDYGGIILANINGTDPHFCMEYNLTNAEDIEKIRIYAKITDNASTRARLYFAGPDGIFTESKSVEGLIKSKGSWQWIEFNMKGNITWTGEISDFRFDITEDALDSGRIEICEIQLLGK